MTLFPKLSGMAGLVQQAKEVQEKLEALQGELSALRIEGQAGGGMVAATVNGQQDVISVKIDQQLLTEDIEMVEDLVVAAIRQATEKSREESQSRMKRITGGLADGLNIPGI
ncbi:MAG: YbaB/EbfC family nucleoid-associated protein [Candidatus Marinimicrobia bacterium]|nr:YbaB/EbfC family nucleoid-associated protein [Candidatus Neomarinimicrobiota bacterium]